MNIVVLNGSPRKGNTVEMIRVFTEEAEKEGHSVEVLSAYELNVGGCIACNACKTSEQTVCSVQDSFQELLPKLQNMDCLVFASPIYFGQITGPLKMILDRFYSFFATGFGLRDIGGKKLVIMTVSGAPKEVFADVEAYLKNWLGKFCKMEHKGSVVAGGYADRRGMETDEETAEEIRQLVHAL